jgi:hypothetical protein
MSQLPVVNIDANIVLRFKQLQERTPPECREGLSLAFQGKIKKANDAFSPIEP